MEQLPLIRMASRATTPHLARLGFTPNLATTLGLITGLGGAACFAHGEPPWHVAGALLFFVYYLLDFCDGELARLLKMSSPFGALYDDFVDWIVHAAFFLGVGYDAMHQFDHVIWMWMGAAAALGGTISAILPFVLPRIIESEGEGNVSQLTDLGQDAGWVDVLIFAFRGLARADFWLIVLGLAIAGYVWVLLPAAAIGSQVFWLLYLKKSARRIIT
jgi:phosphatidylglycerophosphate synthase